MVGLKYKLVGKFDVDLYWFIINPTLHGVQITLSLSTKYLIVKKWSGVWRKLDFVKIYNFI
jgi:hypothetical protein